MIPELKSFQKAANEEMEEAIEYLKREFAHIRAGRATPNLLDGIKVDYYGTQTPLNQLANVTAPEAHMLVLQPYDKSAMQNIEKAIQASNLGLNPNNDGTLIRIPLPILSEERRKELVKLTHDTAEKARVSVRNARRDANDHIKKKVKNDALSEDALYDAEEEIQQLTDEYIKHIDELLAHKEKEILTV